ncbi:MAG: amidohydrolase family protein [Planctomycetes bacterium]|nr:amidohydrolase family protein [Planctomycetota bacterium]
MLHAILFASALALGGEAPAPVIMTGGEPEAAPKVVTAFKAKRLYLGDGRALDDGMLIVADGVITAVGKDLDVPATAAVIEHDGVISPGLIALSSSDGAGGELYDSTRIALPDADAAHAFRPASHDFARERAAGITAVVLTPDERSLVGGTSAVVKTNGGVVVKRGAQLALGLSSAALHDNEFPTSYDGALRELDRLFDDPEGAISKAAAGNLPVLMSVGDRAEIQRALAFAARHHLSGALRGSYWAEELAPAIKASGFAVVCDPFDVGDESRGARSVKALSEAGVRFGFGLDAPARHPDCLRFAAASCVRAGVDPHVARRALTGDAAQIAGVGGRIGRLARGLDADLVLWSGDPIQLSSSIEAVYIDGVRVVGGER